MADLVMPEREYRTPMVRVCGVEYEMEITTSQLEGIGGGDDPDIDW